MKLKRLRKSSIKEAIDNLPSGICFFDRRGMVVLCNKKMHALVFALSGRDLQSLDEMQSILNGDNARARRENNVFVLDDGSVWRLTSKDVITGDGSAYTQVTAFDITELYRRKTELEQDNARLAEDGRRLRQLSADVVAITREEEILRAKMRVHDDLGRSVIATRRLLIQRRPTTELDISAWKNVLRLLRNDSADGENADAFEELTKAAARIGIQITLDGKLPENKAAAYLLIIAMRECATNAVRHANADKLYARVVSADSFATITITDNGALTQGEISEGGGLSTLRRRIEKAGGTMSVTSQPKFTLTVSVPTEKEI